MVLIEFIIDVVDSISNLLLDENCETSGTLLKLTFLQFPSVSNSNQPPPPLHFILPLPSSCMAAVLTCSRNSLPCGTVRHSISWSVSHRSIALALLPSAAASLGTLPPRPSAPVSSLSSSTNPLNKCKHESSEEGVYEEMG